MQFTSRAGLPPPLQAYGVERAISCGLVLAAAAAVQLLAPRVAGGGVTWVMAYLNGNDMCAGSAAAAAAAAALPAPALIDISGISPCLLRLLCAVYDATPCLPAHATLMVNPIALALPAGSPACSHGLFSPLVFLVKWAGSIASMGASLCLVSEQQWVRKGAGGQEAPHRYHPHL